jgi:hypothetical protein
VLEGEEGVFGEGWRVGTQHIYMRSLAGLGVEGADGTGDVKAPVTALRYVFGVAKLEHEFVAGFGVLSSCETAGFDSFAEAVVRQGGRNDVESRSAWCSKKWKNMLNFNK